MTSSIRLFGNHPADEQHVDPVVVEGAGLHVVGRARQMREVRHDRQHAGRAGSRAASSSWRLYSESPSARSQRDRVEAQLAAAQETLLHEQRVHVDEVLGRRDVVVDEHHPIGQRVGHTRRARPDREVMDQDVVGMARVRQIAVVHA